MAATKAAVRFVCLFLIQNFYGIPIAHGQGTSTSPSPRQKCTIPATFVDKTVSYKCKVVAGKNCHKVGDTSIAQYTTAAFECNAGYVRDDGKKFHSVCIDGEWQPPIDKCSKTCEKLNPINVDLTCTYRGSSVECDKSLLPGTKVRPVCKPLHTYESSVPSYQEITCKEDGKWDRALFNCAPDCGKPFVNAEPLIAFGEPEKFGDSPWHVAIYNKDKLLICGGTIISSRLVVSAAHCFSDGAKELRPNDYEIVASKATRNYTVRDNGSQKTYKVKEIRHSPKGYAGINNYYQSNIALIVLNEEITMGATVMPVCVDWTGKKKIPPTEATPGKIVGWGLNENGALSETLKAANLPFINHERCLQLIKDDGKPFLTSDKFCAGSEKGASVLQGDSGGGLMFLEKDRYFIRGILALKIHDSWMGVYTDLNDHLDWIISVRNEVEKDVIKKEIKIDYKNKSQ